MSACNAAGCTGSAAIAAVSVPAIGYVKASNAEAHDIFGSAGAISSDGNTFAVGAYWEDSNATGIGGDQSDNSTLQSGAVYLY